MTDQDKVERYDLIMSYFLNKIVERADQLQGELIYYDEWKKPKYMDSTEREEQAIEEFLNDMDNIGFYEVAELIAHDTCGENISKNNQFYDCVYGDRPCTLR